MKVKKIPQRTCLGCKSVKPKKELVRVVRTPVGEVVVDSTGKKSGRGAYTCPSLDCLNLVLKGSILEKALEINLSDEAKQRLREDLLKIIR